MDFIQSRSTSMTRTSRILQALGGMALAFLVGFAAMAAQDKAATTAKPDQPAATQQSQDHGSMPMGMGMGMGGQSHTFAPGLPGWIKHLPADKQEVARKIWLADGKVVVGTKELLAAKRHELNAVQALPGTDDKTIAALVKEIASLDEKLMNAEIGLRRKLEKEGIPTWGRMDNSMGMGGEGCKMMGGGDGEGKMGMMMGMGGKDHDGHGDAKAGESKPADAAKSGHSM
jgi:hypothetical protein